MGQNTDNTKTIVYQDQDGEHEVPTSDTPQPVAPPSGSYLRPIDLSAAQTTVPAPRTWG